MRLPPARLEADVNDPRLTWADPRLVWAHRCLEYEGLGPMPVTRAEKEELDSLFPPDQRWVDKRPGGLVYTYGPQAALPFAQWLIVQDEASA